MVAVILLAFLVYFDYAKNIGFIDIFLTSQLKNERENERLIRLFPTTIDNYSLQTSAHYQADDDKSYDLEIESGCFNVEGEVCRKNIVAEYRENTGNKIVFVQAMTYKKGKKIDKAMFLPELKFEKLGQFDVRRLEAGEIRWYPSHKFDLMLTQEAIIKKTVNGEIYDYMSDGGDNNVTQYFINAYPPFDTIFIEE